MHVVRKIRFKQRIPTKDKRTLKQHIPTINRGNQAEREVWIGSRDHNIRFPVVTRDKGKALACATPFVPVLSVNNQSRY